MAYEWLQADKLEVGGMMDVAFLPPMPSRRGVQRWRQRRCLRELGEILAAKWPEREYRFHESPRHYTLERIK